MAGAGAGELSLEELLAALGDSHAAQGQAWDPDAWEWDGLLFQAQPSGDLKACQPTEQGLCDKTASLPGHLALAAPLDSAAKASGCVDAAGVDLQDLRLGGEQRWRPEGSSRRHEGAANAAAVPMQPVQDVRRQDESPSAGGEALNPSHVDHTPLLRIPKTLAGSAPQGASVGLAPAVAGEAGKRKEKPAARPAGRCPNYMTGRVPCECTQADASLPVKRLKLTGQALTSHTGGAPRRVSEQHEEHGLQAEGMAGSLEGAHASLGGGGSAQCSLVQTVLPAQVVPGQMLSVVEPLTSTQASLLALGPESSGGVLVGAASGMGFHAGMAVSSSSGGGSKVGGRRGGAKVACQVDGCRMWSQGDGLRGYHKRHKVCAAHAKASTVMHQGCQQRYCQQCGRFHPAADFDGERRSCRMKLQRHNALRKGKAGRGMVLNAEAPPSPLAVPLEDHKDVVDATAPCCVGRQQKLEAEEEGDGGMEEADGFSLAAGDEDAAEECKGGLQLPEGKEATGPGLASIHCGGRPALAVALAGGKRPVGPGAASASGPPILCKQSPAGAVSSGSVSQCSSASPPISSDCSADPELVEAAQSSSSPEGFEKALQASDLCCERSPSSSDLRPAAAPPPTAPAPATAAPAPTVPALSTATPPPTAPPSQPIGSPWGHPPPSPQHAPASSGPGRPLAKSSCDPGPSPPLAATNAGPRLAKASPTRLVLPTLAMPAMCQPPPTWGPPPSGLSKDSVEQQPASTNSFPQHTTSAASLAQHQAAASQGVFAHPPVAVEVAFAQQQMGAILPHAMPDQSENGAPLVHQSSFSCAQPEGAMLGAGPQSLLEAVMAECGPAAGSLLAHQALPQEHPHGTGLTQSSGVASGVPHAGVFSFASGSVAALGAAPAQASGALAAVHSHDQALSAEGHGCGQPGAAGGSCVMPHGSQRGGEGAPAGHMDWQGQGSQGQRSSEGSLEKEGMRQGIPCMPGDGQSSLHTGRMSFKLYQWSPGDFPRDLRCKIMAWLSQMPSELEGYIRPGCTYLTLRLRMPSAVWKELAAHPERAVATLLRQNQGCTFWTRGHFTAQLPGARLVVVGHGRVLGSLPATSQTVLPASLPRGGSGGVLLVHPMVCLDASAPVSTVRLVLPVCSTKARLLCSFRGKYILDADISQEALAALPLAIPGASPGESHATSSRDASCVSITRDRGGDRGTAPLAAECACGCPRGCTCACCSRSSVQKQAACPALRKALLTREEEGSQGMGERQVVAVHLPPLEKWGTLSFEVATPSGLTNALSLLVASPSVCSILRANHSGRAQHESRDLSASNLGLRPGTEDWDRLPRLTPSPPPLVGGTGPAPFTDGQARAAEGRSDGRHVRRDACGGDSDSQPLCAISCPMPSSPNPLRTHNSAAFSRESSPDSVAFSRESSPNPAFSRESSPDSAAFFRDRENSHESSDGEASGESAEREGAEEWSGELWAREFGTALDQSLLALGWLLMKCHEGQPRVGQRAQLQGASAPLEEGAGQAAFDVLWESAGLEAACQQYPSVGACLGRLMQGLRRALLAEWTRAAHPQGSGVEGGVHHSTPQLPGCCLAGSSGVGGGQAVAGLLEAAGASSGAGCCCGSRSGTKRQAATQVAVSQGEPATAGARQLGRGSGCCAAPPPGSSGRPIVSGGASTRARLSQPCKGGAQEGTCLRNSCEKIKSAEALFAPLPPGLGLPRGRKPLDVPALVPLD